MFATLHPANPPEALTLEEALIAYTAGSAFAEFKEAEKGTIAVGQLADIGVLSQEIFEIINKQSINIKKAGTDLLYPTKKRTWIV